MNAVKATCCVLVLAITTGIGQSSALANDGQCIIQYWACDGSFDECYRKETVPCEKKELTLQQRLRHYLRDKVRDNASSDETSDAPKLRDYWVPGVRG